MFLGRNKRIIIVSLLIILLVESVICIKISRNNLKKEAGISSKDNLETELDTIDEDNSEIEQYVFSKEGIGNTDTAEFEYSHDNDVEQMQEFIANVEKSFNYNVWFIHVPVCFDKQEYRNPALQVVLYWQEGEYFFYPLDQCDAELEIEGVERRVCINKYIKKGIVFCRLSPPQPKEYLIDGDIWLFDDAYTVMEDKVRTFKYLGVVEVNTTGSEEPKVAELEENGYTDAVLIKLKEAEESDLPKGNYKVYIGYYEFYDPNAVELCAILQQNDMSLLVWADVRKKDNEKYEVYFLTPTGYYNWLFLEVNLNEDEKARRTVEAERLVLEFERN